MLATPPFAEEEVGFKQWTSKIKALSKELRAEIHIFSSKETEEKVRELLELSKPAIDCRYYTFEDWDDFLILSREREPDDLFIIVSARHNMRSFNHTLDKIPSQLAKYFQENNLIVAFPALEDNENDVAGKTTARIEANPVALKI